MNIGVRRETEPGERRVAATPDSVRQLSQAGLDVLVEKGAGARAGYPDGAYVKAGARLVAALKPSECDVLAHVRPLEPAFVAKLRSGTVTVGLLSPSANLPMVTALKKAGITSFALELVPRISRAQSMDALTSQSLVAGYRAVLEAATRLPRFFPLFMTAAGTIPPARVLVLGAGVAGLQAIATAKRLGARVSAYDVRAASADEVASVGASFISLDLDTADGSGGYATELAEDRAARQRELLKPYVSEADVVITTALIPGRPAPRLITSDMMLGMKSGSVIVDLAAESGGNVEGSVAGVDTAVELADGGGTITLVGIKDVASTMADDASRLYAKNVANLIELMTVDGRVEPDFSDEIVSASCLTHDGTIVHEPTRAALEPAPAGGTNAATASKGAH